MKKATQFSDRYGKVVTEGEEVEERVAPGVVFSAPAVEEPAVEVEEVEEVEGDEVEDDDE